MKRTLLPPGPAVGDSAAGDSVPHIAKTPPGMVRVPGGGIEFLRPRAERVYSIPPGPAGGSCGDFKCSSTPRPGRARGSGGR